MENQAANVKNLTDDGLIDGRITIVENPVEEDYNFIREKYWNKWVAIYQPDHMLTFERGTVVSFADASEDINIQWSMREHMKKNFGRGLVTRFIKEDMEECYVIFRDVR